MSGTAITDQIHFRFRSDTGAVNGTPTWLAAEDTNITMTNTTVPFRLRFSVQNTGTAAVSMSRLGWSKNGGSYSTYSTVSTGLIGNSSASSDPDTTAVTTTAFQLTAGAGSKIPGSYDNNNSFSVSISSGTYLEVEFGLSLVSADLANGDTLDFKLFTASTAAGLTSYDVIPRLTIGSGTTNNMMGQTIL